MEWVIADPSTQCDLMSKLGCIICKAATCAAWDQRTANGHGFLAGAWDALEKVQVVNGNVADDKKLHCLLLTLRR